VLNPAFDPRDVEDQKARLAGVLSSPDVQLTLMTELLVRGAYRGGLSKPLIPDPAVLDHLTPPVLGGFMRSNYLAPRVVLAGAGVDHRRLVDLAGPMLGQLPAAAEGGGGSSSSGSGSGGEPGSQYVGCHTLLPGSAPHTNLILAFEYGGGWHDIQVGGAVGRGGCCRGVRSSSRSSLRMHTALPVFYDVDRRGDLHSVQHQQHAAARPGMQAVRGAPGTTQPRGLS
jgi:hypothetical protein